MISNRLHLAINHNESHWLCPICCGDSPNFISRSDYERHLSESHQGLPCNACPMVSQTVKDLAEHIFEHHEQVGTSALTSMHRRRVADKSLNDVKSPRMPVWLTVDVSSITRMINRGDDCFALCVMHLLAQTDLANLRTSSDCDDQAACQFASFMRSYKIAKTIKGKKPHRLGMNEGIYSAFGINAGQTLDCGDYLKACLRSICQATDRRWADLYQVNLSWSFECTGCHRYIVMTYKDCLLRLDGVKEDSFGDKINRFWSLKQCAVSLQLSRKC